MVLRLIIFCNCICENLYCLFYSKSANVLAVLGAVATEALDMTGFYYSGKPAAIKKKSNKLSRTSTGRYES